MAARALPALRAVGVPPARGGRRWPRRSGGACSTAVEGARGAAQRACGGEPRRDRGKRRRRQADSRRHPVGRARRVGLAQGPGAAGAGQSGGGRSVAPAPRARGRRNRRPRDVASARGAAEARWLPGGRALRLDRCRGRAVGRSGPRRGRRARGLGREPAQGLAAGADGARRQLRGRRRPLADAATRTPLQSSLRSSTTPAASRISSRAPGCFTRGLPPTPGARPRCKQTSSAPSPSRGRSRPPSGGSHSCRRGSRISTRSRYRFE